MKTRFIIEIDHHDAAGLKVLREDLDDKLNYYRKAFPRDTVTVTFADSLLARGEEVTKRTLLAEFTLVFMSLLILALMVTWVAILHFRSWHF